MRLALLFGLACGAEASSDYFEPFPTCADCLPTSIYEAPGIGFSLSLSTGTAAVHFYNNTVKNIASVPASSEYAALMKRLAVSPPPPPLSRWEKLQRSLNKNIGRPATPDVGIIATMLVSLRDATSIAVTSPLDRVAVSHPRIQGLAEADLWDALEYARLRPWVAVDLSRPKVVLPLPAAGGYPRQLLESYAVFAAHGEPRKGDRTFVDLELGLATAEKKSNFWARVTERLQGFCGTVQEGFRLDTVLLTGENATHPDFLRALRTALLGSGYMQREGDGGKKVSFAHEMERSAAIDPIFASARGAAQYARWRQEAPIGCEEQDRCEEERRREWNHVELR
ncbi:unnamed protein product [Fusarium equiseti]|uniref:Uncharacterized protein n=1 Tax=Fusarium equiseti TaxID=61235 RepID=A0A8J2NI41_FUSEQ|nr:unnamed protein product [Fusarium equiseti]